jgi:hypothetical protein
VLFNEKDHRKWPNFVLPQQSSLFSDRHLGSDGYLTTRVGGISSEKYKNNNDFFGVPSKANAIIVKAIKVK